ncbi:MAG TPA: hypothetical protein VN034_09965 [Sphingopyxis sp.]|nr:hypothetical protein [Sphingopyxis sp.]
MLRLLLVSGVAPLFLVAGAAASPPVPEAACTAPGELPAALASWASPAFLKAAPNYKSSRHSPLIPGKAAVISLLQTPKVDYPVRPEKPGGTVSFGGVLRFTVPDEGVWRVALSTAAWVDVVKDGQASTSIAHGRGPACTGIRKMVDYRLAPGTYALQIAANGSETVTLMVAHLP